MDNRALTRAFKLAAQLMELHDENPFKIRAIEGTANALDALSFPVSEIERSGLPDRTGLSKTAAAKVAELLDTGTFPELRHLLEITPPGVVEMLNIKGIGPKKIRALWRDLGIESAEQLREAAEKDLVSKLKGFGKKTQDSILEALEFAGQSKGKLLYPQAESLAEQLCQQLRDGLKIEKVAVAGEIRRRLETVETVRLVAATDRPAQAHLLLNSLEGLTANPHRSGPFAWRGSATESGVQVEVLLTTTEAFTTELFLNSAAEEHLNEPLPGVQGHGGGAPATLRQWARREKFQQEEALYEKAGLQFIVPELREGLGEIELAAEKKLPRLLEDSDLRGSLHNHSTYSDGNHSLREMATFLRDHNYEYLGICDHSQAAHYANGLGVERVRQQHQEIDKLNAELAPFRIFKGIESDILSDGSLDYPSDVLASFDFIVASVHSNLKMDERKATERLLRAIENPYTTMLGHPTGRLLLRRQGYPIDYKAVIDACAKHQVIIEINSNPWRLDLDWRWVRYAHDQGVMLSINPDAHHTEGYADMRYGVLMGRKGFLTKEMTFNAKSVDEAAAYFEKRKAGITPPLEYKKSLFE
ncbi:DNA polymerase/3'-5' exonuclease PolX [Hymenobacter sp. BT770]|uniref:DNA polymerase/3'-5' exonuclease PolX n=1 Tax=Hymenobacter sp. BT770 TaxID=2886942 RepID=UPI001D1018CB|nr:DNA polymerase/3'-5' exonuclease PolX [Hymenobacter sp. BT770]MCC3152858.1 DNA polymerase/3'-5' exonuclease PolX [Hymenobacter sp. BT770]MDO3414933.1 DNA polymerase/3'-5' exonuclease PolX [Hymenobacter sp. BT770]